MNTIMKSFLSLAMAMVAVLTACADGDVGTYQNPVIKYSLPDPTVLRAQDGNYYLYATEDTHNVPVYRSKDLVTWRYVGTAFTDQTRPMDMVPDGGIWAPDINYFDGHYVLYYSKSTWGGTWQAGIGVAVSDRPDRGFHDAHKLFTSEEIGIENCIDPFFIEDDGRKYLFFGSFHDIYGVELSDDGLSLREGAKSTYRLVMTRSRNLFGPYVDRNGRTAVGDNFSPLLNKSPQVYGPGHCSRFVEDDAGQTWIIYHGYQADNVDAGRVTYLDRINWDAQGWPTIQGMRPSTEAPAPLFGDAAGITDAPTTASADDFSIIPAGRDGMFRIEGPAETSFSWQLISAGGQQMLSGRARQTAIIDASRLMRGIYVVRISGPRGWLSEKLLKR